MNDRGKLSTNELLLCLKKLSDKFPIKDNLEKAEVEKIRNFFNQKNYIECIKIIRRQFNLGIRINVRYIDDDPMVKLIDFSAKNNNPLQETLNSLAKNFVKTSPFPHSPASVYLPKVMPIFGSQLFKAKTIPMNIGKSLLCYEFEEFTYCIAHEMSHIFLYSLVSEFCKSEVATDVLVSIMGFSEIGKIGSRRIGYLSKEEFDIIYNAIQATQRSRKKKNPFSFFRRK